MAEEKKQQKKDLPVCYSHLVTGLNKVWHRDQSFIIDDNDLARLNGEENKISGLKILDALVELELNGELKKVNPHNPVINA